MKTFRSTFQALFCLMLLAPLATQARSGYPIDRGLWRLNGTDPSLPFDDLEPLRQIVGGAQYVSLGETIHTSGGFYEMKHRVFRFLVERMGFRVFGMETSWYKADNIMERYVQTCAGTPQDAVKGLFQVWRSTETMALAQWMCEWNQAHPHDRVHFYGFDSQAQAPQDGQALIAFLGRLGIGSGDSRVEGIRVCDGVEEDWVLEGLPYPPELYEQCVAALNGTAAYFDANEKGIRRQTSKEDLAWARVYLVGLRGWEIAAYYSETDVERSVDARDEAMAYLVEAIRDLRFPHERTVLWAHNSHIAKRGAEAYFGPDMGTHLEESLGNKYRAIGLTARETFVDWIYLDLCGLFLIPNGPGSIEHVFSSLGPGTGSPSGVLADLEAHPPFLTPGATYTLGGASMVPVQQFDAVIYLDVSRKMTPTAWASCQ